MFIILCMINDDLINFTIKDYWMNNCFMRNTWFMAGSYVNVDHDDNQE